MLDSIERRLLVISDDLHAELRSGEGEKPRIVGHAAIFDAWTTLYEGRSYIWREVVRPGAFTNALAEGQDVRALWNHDANIVLGRTESGTLRLSEDAVGLLMSVDPPDTQYIRDLVLSPIERRDVSQMSFAFTIRRGKTIITELEAGKTITNNGGERVTLTRDGDRYVEERELLDLNLMDVSPVTYPAYEQTDVAIRSRAERRESDFLAIRARHLECMRMRLGLVSARLKGVTT